MHRWSAIIRSSAVALLLCSLARLSDGAIDDTTLHFPPLYNSFVPPFIGLSYTDQEFGVAIKRLSDAPNMTNNAVSGPLLFVSTEYPTASPFNSDNTLLILQHGGYFGLYDGSGTYLRDLPFVVNAATEPRWSRTDPDALFYVSGNSLKKLSVVAGTSTTVRTFSEYSAIRGRGESDISRDGDHFVFAGDAPGGLANRYVFVYEISTNTKGAVLDTIGHPFNQLYIAPSNSVALGWLADGTARFTGIELFDRNMVFQRQLTHAIGHMHLTRDTNGDDLLIWTNSNDSQPIPNCQNGIVKIRLANAQQSCLLQLDWSLAVHITAGDGSGWAFVETYDPSDPAASAPGWKLYTNELLQVKLDGTETRRLLHHRSRQTWDYGYQPRATVSRDGRNLVFTSNYDLQAILGYPNGYADAYLARVPLLPPPHLTITDQSHVEGNSGTTAFVFTISLSQATDIPVSVDYYTSDVRASAPTDYTALPQTTLTFDPGQTTKTVTVLVNGDTEAEATEAFFVNLINPVNLVIDDRTGRGTIVNDDVSVGDGLTGRYFPNTTLSGQSQSRVDPSVNFDWASGSPGFPGIGPDNFSVRWTGQVEALFTETYSFCTRTDDGARLWVNYQLLVDHWVNQNATEWCGSIALQAGHRYDITMEHFENINGAVAQLFWSSPSVLKAIIPQARLYSHYPVQRRRTIDEVATTPTSSPSSVPRVDTPVVAAPSSTTTQPTVVNEVHRTVASEPRPQSVVATTVAPPPAASERRIVRRRDQRAATGAATTGETIDDESGAGDGLKGTYFQTTDLSGAGSSRVDSTINFEGTPSAPGGFANAMSIRWNGWVQPVFDEAHTFCTRSDDGARLWVNGKLIVDKWIAQPATEWCGPIPLQAGRKYSVTMEYYNKGGGAVAQLLWSSPSTPLAIIPRVRLFSTEP